MDNLLLQLSSSIGCRVEGTVVIYDRFIWSTYIKYEALGYPVRPLAPIYLLPRPHFAVVLDVPVEKSLRVIDERVSHIHYPRSVLESERESYLADRQEERLPGSRRHRFLRRGADEHREPSRAPLPAGQGGQGRLSDPRAYVASMAEESLGLARGSLARGSVPEEFVAAVTSAVKGQAVPEDGAPVLEKKMLSLLAAVRGSSLSEEGFFVRKARWPDGGAVRRLPDPRRGQHLAVQRPHLEDAVPVQPRRPHRGAAGPVSPLRQRRPHRLEGRVPRFPLELLLPHVELSTRPGAKPDLRQGPRLGSEVGLHGDFGTHDSQEKMDEAVARFSGASGSGPRG